MRNKANWQLNRAIREWSLNWTQATLENNWTHVAGNPLEYAVDSNGVVQFRGRIENGDVSANILTLPLGLRPIADVRQVVTISSTTSVRTIQIDNAGGVLAPSSFTNYLDFSGVRFNA